MSCYAPFYVDNPAYPVLSRERLVPVPCGKCPECLKRRSNSWAYRLQQEEKMHRTSAFVTLTYDNDNVTLTQKGFLTLVKKDFQDFMKRLRKKHYNTKLRYWACGEYGSTTMRPHYHAIIYNLNPEHLQDAWGLGETHIGTVSGASIAYTTKYMHKGKLIPVHANDDRQPEFSLMSKGLGKNYLTPEIIEYHQADINRNYLITEGGVKVALPRYYREKIYTPEQRKNQSMTVEQSQEKALEASKKRYKQRTGSLDGYDYSKHQSVKQAIELFKDNAQKNRK